jgi:AmmeMemoRadiSam system protein A
MRDSPHNSALLTDTEKAFLREVARQAVVAGVKDQPPPNVAALAREAEVALAPRLNVRRGAFVTLSLRGRLRGCIGYIEGHVSLVEAVARNGRAAALDDPRFEPVASAELPRLEYEVSALTPLQTVARAEDIVIGRHGILLEKHGRRAVFLPQVATEQGWDLKSTLGHLALKAGLEPGDWHEGARFQVFEAEVF